MSELVLKCEPLNKVLDGKEISKYDVEQVYEISKKDPTELFQASQILRIKHKGYVVSFSKKAFFNIINLCRDICSYCTYKAESNETKLSMMTKEDISQLVELAKTYRCIEALFVTGERPEEKYKEAREWLKKNGFQSTAEYLIHISEFVLENGLFPHTNAGNLTKSEMRELQKTNASMGLMLESSSKRLMQKGFPHYLAPSKHPKARIEVLRNAGELRIPMTSGLLVGIGETPYEIIDSLYVLKTLHKQYHNIQELILQNFHPKEDTLMRNFPAAEENYFKTVVAIARIIMPEMNIQIPPNLSPKSYQSFLSAGINDWGGVSPLTPDYVNPEFSWPQISKIEESCANAGFKLKCRFPVYPEFFDFLNPNLRQKISTIDDGSGFVMEEYWR